MLQFFEKSLKMMGFDPPKSSVPNPGNQLDIHLNMNKYSCIMLISGIVRNIEKDSIGAVIPNEITIVIFTFFYIGIAPIYINLNNL